ncbi:MAG: RHS repeat protein [Deltaproteobacteria bacterium]|nr:RHS repeat protein [Deltaproteobacteria bacterium]
MTSPILYRYFLIQRVLLAFAILKRLDELSSKHVPEGLNQGTDANGNKLIYEYDPLNRLTLKSFPDWSYETFSYDSNGNLIQAANRNITYTLAYDANRRLTSVTDSNNRTTTYQYDAVGNRISMTMPDATIINYTYDQNNRLTRINANTLSFAFTYDNLNRRTKLTYANGITANYTYDAISRLANLIYKTSNNSTIDSFAYTYDNINNKLTAQDPAGNHQYQYDAIYRLITAHHTTTANEAYTYDPVGNRLTTTVDNANRLTEDQNHTYQYDNNGNLILKTHKITQAATTYQYDYENRLIKATMPNGAIAEYKYDPFGRRIQKKITDTSGIKTYTYTYDNEDIILEYLLQTPNSEPQTTRYIHGPGIDEPLAIQHSSADYYYHADTLGSIARMTDQNGNIVQTYKYDSFGNITASSILQPYAYTGREYDKETGFYYLRNRYYDPRIGRFISKRPDRVWGRGCEFVQLCLAKPRELYRSRRTASRDISNWMGDCISRTFSCG